MISVGEGSVLFPPQGTSIAPDTDLARWPEVDKADPKLGGQRFFSNFSMTREGLATTQPVDEFIPQEQVPALMLEGFQNARQRQARFLELRVRCLRRFIDLDQARLRQRQLWARINFNQEGYEVPHPEFRCQLYEALGEIRIAERALLSTLERNSFRMHGQGLRGPVESEFFQTEMRELQLASITGFSDNRSYATIDFPRRIEHMERWLNLAEQELERVSNTSDNIERMAMLQNRILIIRETLASLYVQQLEWARAAIPYDYSNMDEHREASGLLYENRTHSGRNKFDRVNRAWQNGNADFVRETCNQALLHLPLEGSAREDFINRAIRRVLPEAFRSNAAYNDNLRIVREAALRRLSRVANPSYDMAFNIVRDVLNEAIEARQRSSLWALRGPTGILNREENRRLLEESTRTEASGRGDFLRRWLRSPTTLRNIR